MNDITLTLTQHEARCLKSIVMRDGNAWILVGNNQVQRRAVNCERMVEALNKEYTRNPK